LFGAGVEDGDVVRDAALPGGGVVKASDAEVARDVGDDVGDWAIGGVVLEVRPLEAFEKFGVQGFLLVGRRVALDGVLDVADDFLAVVVCRVCRVSRAA
jgi:hypothetical protein